MNQKTVLWALAILAAALLAAMTYLVGGLKPSLIAAQLSFSREAFDAIVGEWARTEGSLDRFNRHFAIDYVFIVVFSLLGFLLGRRLVSQRPAGTVPSMLPWLMPLAGIFDCIEDLLHQSFIAAGQQGAARLLYPVAGSAALAKHVLMIAFIALAVRAWRGKPVP